VTREQLEHLLRASANVLRDRRKTILGSELVVIGSQSILGQFPDAPPELTRSMEADLYPLHEPGRADEIDGAIGEGSSFHESFGIYAQGVGPETAVLPEGWQQRLVAIKTPATSPAVGLCLEVHDLAVSKYIAGRPKDLDFTQQLARHGMTEKSVLLQRLDATKVDEVRRKLVLQRIKLQHGEKS
jgi:hypothetical protein